jgi:hypothetical protein
MQLFLVAFQQPIPFGISIAVVTLMIWIILKSALSSEGGSRWVRRITNPNMKFLSSSSCPTSGPARRTARSG